MRNLDGKVAVVTGGTFVVGRGIASALAQYGARVFVTGRSAHDGVANEEQTTGIRCDHQVDAEVTAAFERVAREAGKIEPKAKADTSTGKRKVDHLSMLESVRTDVFIEARNFVRQLIQSRGHV